MKDRSHRKTVSAWEETITLSTYTPAPPDLSPMFLEKRVNQATSGRVYPNPFTDGLSSESEGVKCLKIGPAKNANRRVAVSLS